MNKTIPTPDLEKDWPNLLVHVNQYASAMTDAAMHQAASRSDIAQSQALAALRELRRAAADVIRAHVHAALAAQAVPAIPKGWPLNHAQQQVDEDGPVDGVWEVGILDEEDGRFSPVVTVDTGLYYQSKHAEPLARAILALFKAASPAPAEAKEEPLTLAQMYESGRDLAVEEIQEAVKRHQEAQPQAAQPVAVIAAKLAAMAINYTRNHSWDHLDAEVCTQAARMLAAPAQTQAVRDVLAERRRHISAEGWTPEHDDKHVGGSLAVAAACYAAFSNPDGRYTRYNPPPIWPWASKWWKPKEPRRNLVKAGSLIIAEIERLDRAALRSTQGGE